MNDPGAQSRANAPLRWILCTLLLALSSAPGGAEQVSKAHMQSLDEQVQEVKSDVLAIAAEKVRGLVSTNSWASSRSASQRIKPWIRGWFR